MAKSEIKEMLHGRNQLQAACVVKYPWGEQLGIAIMNTHSIGEWKAGDVMVLWEDGDVTIEEGLDKEDIVIADLWEHLRQTATKEAP